MEDKQGVDSTSDDDNTRGDPGEHTGSNYGEDESVYQPTPWENFHGVKRLYTAIFLGIILTKEPSSTRSFPKWRIVYTAGISPARPFSFQQSYCLLKL
jgi:hypothetical protein